MFEWPPYLSADDCEEVNWEKIFYFLVELKCFKSVSRSSWNISIEFATLSIDILQSTQMEINLANLKFFYRATHTDMWAAFQKEIFRWRILFNFFLFF